MTAQKALAAIDPDACVALLQTLIRTRSTNPPAHEITLATLVRDRLAAAGLVCELLPFEEHRANLIARVKGDGSAPGLIFSAHFDTVPEGELPWDHPPYAAEIHDGRIYGRGAADMKSGMAAMIAAAEAVAASGVALRGDLILAFTSGETSNCIGAKLLAESGKLRDAGAFLVSEPTGLDVGIAEKTALWLRAVASGRTAHGSQPHAGDNAIAKLVAFLARLPQFDFAVAAHPLLGHPTIQIGRIQGGVNINVTPDQAMAELDIRLLPEQDADARHRRPARLRRARASPWSGSTSSLPWSPRPTTRSSPSAAPLAKRCCRRPCSRSACPISVTAPSCAPPSTCRW